MKKNDSKNPFVGVFVVLLSMSWSIVSAQDMYVSSGAVLHYSGGNFASGVIDNNNGGAFSVSADYAHSTDNYVDGPVAFLASGGTYDVSLESGATDRSPNFTSTGVATMSYEATAVPTGIAPAGYVLADAEMYTFTGSVSAGSATPLSSTDFDVATGTVVSVFADANGGTWSTTATPGTTTVMTFAKEDLTPLGVSQFDVQTFAFYPNPVKANVSSIRFNLPSTVKQLDVVMYDVTGKLIQRYNNVAVQTGANSIPLPNVEPSLYFMQFSFNNGEETITKRLIVE